MDAYKQCAQQNSIVYTLDEQWCEKFLFLFSFTLSIVLFFILTIWTFFIFNFLNVLWFGDRLAYYKTCRLLGKKRTFYHHILYMSCTVRFLETDFSHFPYCGFQTLSHVARWLNIMSRWPLSGKDNLPKTGGIRTKSRRSRLTTLARK